MPRCYVPAADAAGSRLALPDAEAHHVARVLRLRQGDPVIVFDGRGHEWDARIALVTRAEVSVEIGTARTPVPEPAVAVTLAIGLLKGDQMDAVVRDATALGVTRIVPIVTEHVAVPVRAWSREGIEDRWHRVAIAAAKQSGRAVVPPIVPVTPLDRVLADSDTATRIVCVEPAHGHDAHGLGTPAPAMMLFVGPEGGWSNGELDRLLTGAARRLSLGPRTLRAELAPVVALSALRQGWGW